MNHIAIVEDDASIAEMLSFHMTSQGYQINHFADGEEARKNLMETDYDLVLLDIMLPNCNGLDICKALRQRSPTVPILMLTSLDGEADRVIGLELGADDYLTKPFSMRECTARVKALLRRSQLSAPVEAAAVEVQEKLDIAELSLDSGSRVVTLDDRTIELTAREFDLLFYLVQHHGRVYSRSQLLDAVWGYSHDGYEHTINTHINRLRNKLKRSNGEAEFIQTVWGVGYKFVNPEQATES